VDEVSLTADTESSYLVLGSRFVTSTTHLPGGYIVTFAAASHTPPNVFWHPASIDVALRLSTENVAVLLVAVTPVTITIPGGSMPVRPKTFLGEFTRPNLQRLYAD
jgi:hypothetical protein